jgi:hypothetical protein
MKKILTNELLKNTGYLLYYWVFLVIIPFFVGFSMYVYLNYNPIEFLNHAPINYTPICIMLYSLFIAPFLYFIPYRKVKPKKGFLFIFLGLVVPYLFIYLSIYLYSKATFHPSF